MAESSMHRADAPAAQEDAQARASSRSAVCRVCRKLPNCFGRLFCPTRDTR